MIKLSTLLILFISISTFSQELDFSKHWSFLGPERKPLEDRRSGATGIGPVDYLEVHQNKKGHLDTIH